MPGPRSGWWLYATFHNTHEDCPEKDRCVGVRCEASTGKTRLKRLPADDRKKHREW